MSENNYIILHIMCNNIIVEYYKTNYQLVCRWIFLKCYPNTYDILQQPLRCTIYLLQFYTLKIGSAHFSSVFLAVLL